VVPLPYDFDFAGIVNTPYAIAKSGSHNVRLRRYANQPGVRPQRLRSTLKYLDGFYAVINDPRQVERRMIRRCKAD